MLSPHEAGHHRQRFERAERQIGPLHYKDKVHTVLTSPFELATHPAMLAVVEALLGPDILLYNATYIVKEPGTPAHVAWHQDLTYWGLSSDQQVSAWLALAPASVESGCMRMIPASHLSGRRDHERVVDDDNVLHNGQRVTGVDDSHAVWCPLDPGEASFHHGWTLHASSPNLGRDRRIGLNVQYLAPSVCQTMHDGDTAMLVRGADRYGHFRPDHPATTDLDPAAIERWRRLDAQMKANYERG